MAMVPDLPADVTVTVGDDFVATVELHRPPENYFDRALIRALADAYTALDADPRCRAIVLCSEGKHFCAGANLSGPDDGLGGGPAALYREAIRLFEAAKPVVAAVQGAAVGGGLGLACSADFRVACPQARFAANFARLGFHHGFGLTVTLPAIIGQQHSLRLLYTGQRIGGDEAARIGLCDRLVPADQVRAAAHELAAEIAQSAPLAVSSIRATMRGDLAGRVREATDREAAEQDRLRTTADWREGVLATAERRAPRFQGR
ncbi:MAG TPA: enoyl-CoA hydratase/isomerase family protein [Streptosporangiaceae bacterium]|nr:enoyl-CoA hydratase/isomerase family protein [Streptosporangiaceae bacterium]